MALGLSQLQCMLMIGRVMKFSVLSAVQCFVTLVLRTCIHVHMMGWCVCVCDCVSVFLCVCVCLLLHHLYSC